MNFARRPHDDLTIDITSLVDVVFLLLIFFMVTTTFATQSGIGVNLPQASARERPSTEAVSISITADGSLFLDRSRVTADGLRGGLRELRGQRGDETVVVIRADEAVLHGKVVEAMDAARSAGFRRLAIATRTPAEK
jgi:biopolymer transport protein ExbD